MKWFLFYARYSRLNWIYHKKIHVYINSNNNRLVDGYKLEL